MLDDLWCPAMIMRSPVRVSCSLVVLFLKPDLVTQTHVDCFSADSDGVETNLGRSRKQRLALFVKPDLVTQTHVECFFSRFRRGGDQLGSLKETTTCFIREARSRVPDPRRVPFSRFRLLPSFYAAVALGACSQRHSVQSFIIVSMPCIDRSIDTANSAHRHWDRPFRLYKTGVLTTSRGA